MASKTTEKVIEVARAIAPLMVVVGVLQVTLVHAPLELFLQFIAGAFLAGVGMVLLLLGVDLGILPMGRFIGAELPQKGSLALILAVAFALGFATTAAEPDVLVLAGQADEASGGSIPKIAVLYVIAGGVGLFTALGSARIIFGWPIKYLVVGAYLAMLVLALFTPDQFVALSFDAGSVTTGVLAAPVLIAIAMGLSSVLAGRSAVGDGFGISGLVSVGAILSVLLMGVLWS